MRQTWLLVAVLVVGHVAACSPSIREGYPKTYWGMTPEQVKALYGDAQTEVSGTGETFIRAKTKPFGRDIALTAFTFLPKYGLNAILYEFPDPTTRLDGVPSDYARPTKERAETIKGTIEKAFTAKYGKATYVVDGPGGSSLGWHNTEDGASLSTLVLDAGRTDIRLWARTYAKDATTTKLQDSLAEDVLTRTAPSTWSQNGAMNARFGMGPGDVRDHYPELHVHWTRTDDPNRTYGIDSYVEGE